jgi:hypothetical protein
VACSVITFNITREYVVKMPKVRPVVVIDEKENIRVTTLSIDCIELCSRLVDVRSETIVARVWAAAPAPVVPLDSLHLTVENEATLLHHPEVGCFSLTAFILIEGLGYQVVVLPEIHSDEFLVLGRDHVLFAGRH